MSTPYSTQLTIEEAHRILKQFDCLKPNSTDESLDKALIREALLLIVHHSDYQILGVCADAIAPGRQALESYASVLGYTPNLNLTPVEGPVYIKFNPKSNLCYANSYTGEHRGVLVSCQSAYESGINEMYGHLPLDLFKDNQ